MPEGAVSTITVGGVVHGVDQSGNILGPVKARPY